MGMRGGRGARNLRVRGRRLQRGREGGSALGVTFSSGWAE